MSASGSDFATSRLAAAVYLDASLADDCGPGPGLASREHAARHRTTRSTGNCIVLNGSGFLRPQPATQRKNTGTKNVAMKVAASMPPITPVPIE